jgi:hypothetical protein
MDTQAATTVENPTPVEEECSAVVGSNEALRGAVTSYPLFFGYTSILLTIIIVVLIVLWMMDWLKIARPVTSTYSSTFISPMATKPPTAILGRSNMEVGNNPNWRMGGLNSGSGSTLDPNRVSSGNSLMFGIDGYKKSPYDKKQHLAPNPVPPADPGPVQVSPQQLQQRATEQLKQRYRRENFTESQCNQQWDPQATEEAKVLASVGSYRKASEGMGRFVQAVNDSTTLTDAQLEAIMQGGEPYTVSPMGIDDSRLFDRFDQLSAQQHAQRMDKPLGYGTHV